MLATRSTAAEHMDTECRDYADYRRCLRDLGRVNTVTMTHRPMLAWLARQTAGAADFSVLDVACGYGDGLRRIRRRFPHARLTGIDLNPWAIRAARDATEADADIAFIEADVFTYRPDPAPDFIISAQFTHHLDDAGIVRFIAWMQATARRGWFIGDLHRHAFPYYGFGLLALAAGWHRFVRQDGRISIARAFTRADWRGLLDQTALQAEISWHVPFRLCVAHSS